MATFNKFNAFTEHLAEKVHNLPADTLKIFLTAGAPDPALDVLKADLTDLTTGGGYTAGGITVPIDTGSTQVGGVYTLAATGDVQWTGSGGGFGPFRYAVLYNDTPSSPAKPLIGWWDYGSPVSCNASETFTVDLTTTLLTIT